MVRFSLREFNAQPDGQARDVLLGCCSSRRWAGQVAAGRPYASLAELLRSAAAAAAALDPADLSQALAGHPRIGARPPAREQAAGKQAAGKQAAGKQAAGKQAAGKQAAGKQAAGEGTALDQAALERAALAQAAGNQAAGERAAGERAAGERAGWSEREQAGVDTADEALMRALADGNRAYEQRFGHIYLACATGRTGRELLALLTERLGNDPAAEWRVVAAELEKINQIRLRQLISAEAADEPGGGDQ
ncbi:MAG TPA: 2-oxo-4-hydroxy-4-carboxy-5-ureidoimidazoline decarboxylase [Streptosporangiaceae bacterium]